MLTFSPMKDIKSDWIKTTQTNFDLPRSCPTRQIYSSEKSPCAFMHKSFPLLSILFFVPIHFFRLSSLSFCSLYTPFVLFSFSNTRLKKISIILSLLPYFLYYFSSYRNDINFSLKLKNIYDNADTDGWVDSIRSSFDWVHFKNRNYYAGTWGTCVILKLFFIKYP